MSSLGFGRVFVLNLDESTERLRRTTARLGELSLQFDRFPALRCGEVPSPRHARWTPGLCGAAHSHRAVLETIRESDIPSAVVLEDDAVFRDDLANQLAAIAPQLDRVPWDVFYFGLHLVRDGGKLSPNLGRVIEGYHAHAYAVTARAAPRLIACIDRALEALDGSFDGFDDPSVLKIYADPILAIQEPCYSYTRGAILDRTPQYFHRFSREEFMANCREMREWESAVKQDHASRPKETDVPTILKRAQSHQRAGRLEAAQSLYKKILDRHPNHAEAMHYRGLLAHQSGDEDLGMELLTRSLALDPRPEFYNNFAMVLSASGKNEDALDLFDEAIRLRPEYPEAFANRAAVLDRLGLTDECMESCRKAIALKPEQGDPHARLGTLLLKQGKLEEAIPVLRDAVRYAPRLPEAHLAMGNALREQGDLEAALAAYRQAVELRPGWAEAHSNLGSTLQELGQLDEAVRVLRKAVELKGDYVDAHWNLSLALLAAGDFEAGWPEYEWRRKLKSDGLSSRNLVQPEWNGCSLRGRTILVICEQGLGDTIQFIRYVPMLKERGAEVIVECQPRLRGLLEMIGGFRVVARGEPLPVFDTHARLLSLPAIFGTAPDSIPARVPYLKADPARVHAWETQISGGGMKIGIAWQGSAGYKGDRRRSLPLRALAPLSQVPGIGLFSLQQGEGAAQVENSGFPVHRLDPSPDVEGAFLDTAAIIGELDLVITSDTAIAHLAGALGAPVWVALAHAPDWRWMLDRPDTPWYPTMRLFRQSVPGDWAGVFERMAVDLRMAMSGDDGLQLSTPLLAPCTPGQLLDRISILRIKTERVRDPRKLVHVQAELDALEAVRQNSVGRRAPILAMESELRQVNETLWSIEDDLRQCELLEDFGPRFVELARSVYVNNDLRSKLKQRIDQMTGSGIIEVKSYGTQQGKGAHEIGQGRS